MAPIVQGVVEDEVSDGQVPQIGLFEPTSAELLAKLVGSDPMLLTHQAVKS